MSEPEFYAIRRSGVLLDDGGVELINADKTRHVYYGVTYEMLEEAKEQGAADSSATVSGVHSWEDWGLFLTDVSIGAPEIEQNTTTVPGRHGVLDYSETITGSPVYHNRSVELTFLKLGTMAQWHEEYSEILEWVHGQVRQLIFDTRPGYYLEGRCSGDSVRVDAVHHQVTIQMDADPFWKSCADTASDWLWDPFCFEDGVIREYGNIYVAGVTGDGNVFTKTVTVVGGVVNIRPTLIVTPTSSGGFGDLKVTVGRTIYTFTHTSTEAGKAKIYSNAILISPGENTVTLTWTRNSSIGTVYVSIRFQEERL